MVGAALQKDIKMLITKDQSFAIDGKKFNNDDGTWISVDTVGRETGEFDGYFEVREGVGDVEGTLWAFHLNIDGGIDSDGGSDGELVLNKLEDAIVEFQYVEQYPGEEFHHFRNIRDTFEPCESRFNDIVKLCPIGEPFRTPDGWFKIEFLRGEQVMMLIARADEEDAIRSSVKERYTENGIPWEAGGSSTNRNALARAVGWTPGFLPPIEAIPTFDEEVLQTSRIENQGRLFGNNPANQLRVYGDLVLPVMGPGKIRIWAWLRAASVESVSSITAWRAVEKCNTGSFQRATLGLKNHPEPYLKGSGRWNANDGGGDWKTLRDLEERPKYALGAQAARACWVAETRLVEVEAAIVLANGGQSGCDWYRCKHGPTGGPKCPEYLLPWVADLKAAADAAAAHRERVEEEKARESEQEHLDQLRADVRAADAVMAAAKAAVENGELDSAMRLAEARSEVDRLGSRLQTALAAYRTFALGDW